MAHVQVVINCPYSVAQLCTREDMLAHNLGAPYIDNIMSYNFFTTILVEAWTSNAIDWRSYSNSIFEINLTLLQYEILEKLVTYM